MKIYEEVGLHVPQIAMSLFAGQESTLKLRRGQDYRNGGEGKYNCLPMGSTLKIWYHSPSQLFSNQF